MTLGKDFWFWIKLLISILKAILDFDPADKKNPGSLGFDVLTGVIAQIVEENEDDDRIASDVENII